MNRGEKNKYATIIEKVFLDRYKEGLVEVPFTRADLLAAGAELGISNIGDVVYSIRYRTQLPESVLATQPRNKEWIIEGAGRSRYVFRLVKTQRIQPNPNLAKTKVPDATPEIISEYALTDEQALLAKVRYNRLVDLFLGLAAYSLQNHLRTNVREIGQIEIDEIYVGIDKYGCQYILPLQAKGGKDRHSVVQIRQDIKYCRHKFPSLICRALSAQFIENDLIALFELKMVSDQIEIVEERHYQLVPIKEITASDLKEYSRNARA